MTTTKELKQSGTTQKQKNTYTKEANSKPISHHIAKLSTSSPMIHWEE